MSTGSINGVPVMDHRAAVLAQQASDVLSMAAEDHPARDSLRRAASDCLDRARLLLGNLDGASTDSTSEETDALVRRIVDEIADATKQPRTPLHPALLDELAIIVQEAISLPTSDEPATAIATIRHASYTLWRILGTDTACPRITHFNGHLSDRYAAQRRVLGVLASLPAGEDGAS